MKEAITNYDLPVPLSQQEHIFIGVIWGGGGIGDKTLLLSKLFQ